MGCRPTVKRKSIRGEEVIRPRRCIECNAPLEWYGELLGIEGWHPTITAEMSIDYSRCGECAIQYGGGRRI